MAPFGFYVNSIYFQRSKNQFEIGYPAHPVIIDERRKVINQGCFFAPSVIKNEIEFMHRKIDNLK